VAELLRVNDVADDVVDLVGITQRVPADDREQLPREQLDTIRFAELLGEDLALRGEAQRALGDDLLALLAPGVARLGALDVGDARALCGLALPDRRLCKGTPNESILLASQLRRARCAVRVLLGGRVAPRGLTHGNVRRAVRGVRAFGLAHRLRDPNRRERPDLANDLACGWGDLLARGGLLGDGRGGVARRGAREPLLLA
jgi:hypothetical protein